MSDDEDKTVTGDDASSEPGGDPGGEPSGDQPLLTVAMMVKDEEGFLEDALVSAQPWADEIVVVDTGSTDRTVEIARRHGAKVSHFQWCDSFAAARNTTLERSTGRWILVLDADELLEGEDPARLRRHLEGMSAGYPFEVLT